MALFEEGTDPSYYAILNVPKDASYEDIKRAYRGLAQVFHPDKHLDDDLRDKAQEAFAKLQEAYEVLSDPQKRDVYDVYGKEGLNAGMSLGTKLKNTDELRKEWEAFKAQQRAAREEAAASHRGIYICRVDGRGWAHGDWAAVPQIRMVVVQNSLDVSVTDADVLLLQGQAALRGNQGSGSVVAGYKRVLSPNDELEAHAVLGLRSLLQLTSTRRLGHYTTAAATGSYSWDQGMGLQLTTSRQLTHSSSASLTWVVGPPNASSMGVSVSHRGSKYVITGKIDLGLVTSLSSRLTYLLNDNLSLKVTGRIGTSGVDAELGLARKFSPTSSLYAGSAVSLQGGTAFKVRYSRAGQVFEFPILLTGDCRDWEVLAAASIVPPLASFLLMRYVVGPLKRWQRRRAETAARSEHAEQLRREANRAAAERALLQPVARRKAAAEAAAGGLVILEAVYGLLHEYRLVRAQQGQSSSSEAAAGPQRDQQRQQQQELHRKQEQQAKAQQQASSSSSSSSQEQPQMNGSSSSSGGPAADAAAGSSSSSSSEGDLALPPPWLDVTDALQYLVSGGKLELHGGVSKLGLMGFADVAEGDKELYVAYCYKQRLFEKVVGDADLLRLPGAGEPVCEPDVADRLWAKYRSMYQQQQQPQQPQEEAQ
uniref:J domain-containing protein n=1 Tax=Tetradesmus obliquus TaxID=3088 RepID=A0A383W4E3_TETOB|eukprot:jgi/Sobl393_1/1136/SZX72090.1